MTFFSKIFGKSVVEEAVDIAAKQLVFQEELLDAHGRALEMDEVRDEQLETQRQRQRQEEWVWVEGYKGTNINMECTNDTQFGLGNMYLHEGKVEICKGGFHFCSRLSHVFRYYPLTLGKERNRYFRVMALVRKETAEVRRHNRLERAGALWDRVYFRGDIDTKDVAKNIVFLEEVSFEDLKIHLDDPYPLIKTEEQYKSIEDYKELFKSHFFSEMRDMNFSETYSAIKFDEISYSNEGLETFLETTRAYFEEVESRDMLIYLLEKDNR